MTERGEQVTERVLGMTAGGAIKGRGGRRYEKAELALKSLLGRVKKKVITGSVCKEKTAVPVVMVV